MKKLDIVSYLPQNNLRFQQEELDSKGTLIFSGIHNYALEVVNVVSGVTSGQGLVSFDFGDKDISIGNDKHTLSIEKDRINSKISLLQFSPEKSFKLMLGTVEAAPYGGIFADTFNLTYRTGNLNLDIRPKVNGVPVLLSGEESDKSVLVTGNQIISGEKFFVGGLAIGNQTTPVINNRLYLFSSGQSQHNAIETFGTEYNTNFKFGDQAYDNLYFNTTTKTISGEYNQPINFPGGINVSGTGFFNAIDLSAIDNLNLSGIDISITDSNISLLGTSNIPTLADIFPASSAVRRYRPMGVGSTTSSSPSYQNIQYFPFLIRKDAVNPQIAIELVSSGAAALSSFPIRYGIYSGQDGFQGAKLFHSGSINCTTTGIFKANIPLTLKKGPYIIATSNTGVLSPAATFRASSAQTFGEIFGEPTFNTTLFNGNPTTVFYDTGVDLKATIGSSFITSLARAPIPCIEY